MKKILAFTLAFILILSGTGIIVSNAAPDWLSGWSNRVLITVDQNDIDAALSHFPVLVYLSSSCGRNNEDLTFVFDEIGGNSLKIAVTKSDGTTELYVEIEKWDNGAEEAWFWVSIAGWTIASGADTDLYLYYDNTHADNNARVGITNSAVSENVWDATFELVSHLRDNPDNAHVRDSTTNDLDGDKKGANEPVLTTVGMIDGSQNFDGSNDYIDFVGAFTSIRNDDTFTIEGWFYADHLPGVWAFLWSAAGLNVRIYLAASSTGKLRLLRGPAFDDEVGTSIQATTERYIVIAFSDATTGKLYVDGAWVEDLTVGAQHDIADDINLGEYFDGGLGTWSWDGKIDEFRISSTTRSAAWIKATYETENDDLLDWGSEESLITTPNLLFGAGFNSSSPYVELHWNHSLIDVQFFEVQNSSDAVTWAYLGQSNTANYTDNQVLNGTERYYRVRACNQTGGTWYNSSWTLENFETVYFIEAVGGTIYQDVNVTGAWVEYDLTSINVNIGTHDGGNLASTFLLDGDTYNISETVGAPAWLISFNWTNVDQNANSMWILLNAFYSGNQAHDIDLQLYNFTSTSWADIALIPDMVGFEWINASIYDLRIPNDFINSTGAVLGRIIHVDAGNINHDILIDFLRLQTFIPFEEEADPGWLPGWNQRVKITADHDDIDTELTDFPVLIYISSSSGINNEDVTFIFDEVGANSLKIAVTEDDGTTELYIEVEKWDLGNEQAWLWAKTPSILYDADTDIYFYYDNDHIDNTAYVGLTNSVVAENVWDADFLMVQHQAGVASPILDSTSNDIDMTETGDPTYQQAGAIDGEIDYDGNDYHLSAVDVFDAIFGADKGTIGLWIKTTASDATSRVVFSIEGAYVFNFKYGEGGLLKTFWSGTHLDSARTTTQINTGAQFYVVSTYDGTNQRVYVNGILEATDACNLYNITALTRASGIATSWNGGNPIDANIDDARVSKIDRSPSWIEASYETGRDDLLDWGLEEEKCPPVEEAPLVDDYSIIFLAMGLIFCLAIYFLYTRNK